MFVFWNLRSPPCKILPRKSLIAWGARLRRFIGQNLNSTLKIIIIVYELNLSNKTLGAMFLFYFTNWFFFIAFVSYVCLRFQLRYITSFVPCFNTIAKVGLIVGIFLYINYILCESFFDLVIWFKFLWSMCHFVSYVCQASIQIPLNH